MKLEELWILLYVLFSVKNDPNTKVLNWNGWQDIQGSQSPRCGVGKMQYCPEFILFFLLK